MANAGKYEKKTGTFITTTKMFSNLFITLNIVYMYIYNVPQLNICHWELTSWHFG